MAKKAGFRLQRRLPSGHFLKLTLLATAAAKLADGSQGFGATSFGAETTTEVMHEVQPGIGAAVETIEDGFEMWWDLAGFISPSLAAGPVEQLEVLASVMNRQPRLLQRRTGVLARAFRDAARDGLRGPFEHVP